MGLSSEQTDGGADSPLPMLREANVAPHSPSLAAHLFGHYQKQRHCDVAICFHHCDFQETVRAHKVVLERADFFSSLFSGPLSSGEESLTVTLDDPAITRPGLLAAVDFLYSDCLPVAPTPDLLGTLACASLLLFARLERACVTALLGQLAPDTVVTVLECGTRYYLPTLRAGCMHFLCRHAWNLADPVLRALPADTFASLVDRPDLLLPDVTVDDASEAQGDASDGAQREGGGCGRTRPGCGVESEWFRYEARPPHPHAHPAPTPTPALTPHDPLPVRTSLGALAARPLPRPS